MGPTVYLDQNVLSRLRTRKLRQEKDETLIKLKFALQNSDAQVIFSHTNLDEIKQIPNKNYQDEHIELLDEIGAKYIDPVSHNIDARPPKEIWKAYLENEDYANKTGLTEAYRGADTKARKLSGLSNEKNLGELDAEASVSLKNVYDNILKALNDSHSDEYKQSVRNQIQRLMEIQAEGTISTASLSTSEDQKFGPGDLRAQLKLKRGDLHSLPSNKVLSIIEREREINIDDVVDQEKIVTHPMEMKISLGYLILNWVGYYADNLTSGSKKKDRFNAYSNDREHATIGCQFNFIISNDRKFLKKTKACYEYIDSSTQVCTPDVFLRDHCKYKGV